MVNLFIVGATFDVIGKIMIGVGVLFVHKRVMKEHKIDVKVLKEMKNEQMLVAAGIASIIIGYFFHIIGV